MTDLEQRWVDARLTQAETDMKAAEIAGYKHPKQDGARVAARPHVQAALAEARKERVERTQITADKVLKELALLGFANMQDYMRVLDDGSACMDVSKLTREQAAAIQEINSEVYLDKEERPVKKCRLKLICKEGPLVQIGKHLGMFEERIRITTADLAAYVVHQAEVRAAVFAEARAMNGDAQDVLGWCEAELDKRLKGEK